MNDWPIGLSTGCFIHDRFTDVLERIREGGFSIIEVCSAPGHLDYHDLQAVEYAAGKIGELGLEPFSFHAPFAEHIDITSLEHQRFESSVQEILRAAEAAAKLGVRHFVIHPGPEEERQRPSAEHLNRLENAARALNRVADYCQQNGMTLILENMLGHLLFGQISDLLWIMGAIDRMNVGICLDTGHAHLAGDLYSVLHKLSGHLKMLHANDNGGQYDDHRPPGRGDIDWRNFVESLIKYRFGGSVILELSAAGGSNGGDVLQAARESRSYIRRLAQETELAGR